MKIRAMSLLLITLLLLLTTSCIVRSSLVYLDKDTEGVPNLLSNPDFNAYSLDPDEALLGWTIHSNGGSAQKYSVFIDGKEAFKGNSSIRIDASENEVVLLSDAFKVRRYGGFYSRIYAKSSERKGPQITMRLLTFRENGTMYNKFKTKMRTGTEWERESISAGFLKPGVSFGRLQIIIPPFSEGSVWLDDAGCWEVHHFRID